MMANLFSSFDPSTSSNLSLNWLSLTLPLLLLPSLFWTSNNRLSSTLYLFMKSIHKEMSTLLNPTYSQGSTLLLMAIMWTIISFNLMGLTPYTFTPSSHMTISVSLALPLWLSFLLYGWYSNTNKMFTHLLPSGTPSLLMPFMVLIETISNLIRPLTLSVRLTANMIAGHLLLTLLSNQNSLTQSHVTTTILATQTLLLSLEMAVAMIQGYVFMVLITLYSTEVH